jgi:hypothetical protein
MTQFQDDLSRATRRTLITILVIGIGALLCAIAYSLWPTATASDANSSGAMGYSTASGRHPGTTLTDATVRNWATPTAHDARGRHDKSTQGANLSRDVSDLDGQQNEDKSNSIGSLRAHKPVLNSSWVATLLGYPSMWAILTIERACELWGTRSFRKSRKRSEV